MPRPSNAASALILAILFSATGLRGATPDWVRQLSTQTLPSYDAETNAVVLLDEVSVVVSGPNDYVEHYRRAVKILRPDGRDEANLAVYLQGREKLTSLHCWALDHSGKEFELRDKDFLERGVFYGFDLYNDVRQRTGTCPSADPGSVIAFEYEVQRHGWVNEFERGFQESIPVRESHVVLKLPAGWEYKALWANGGPFEPARTANGGWEWSLHDLAPIEREPMRPALWALSLRLGLVYFGPDPAVSNAGSWEAIGRWYTQLTADRRSSSPELAERARQLAEGKKDFDGKARALASFLQSDVRYVAVEIGLGGYQPHPAGDIFHARYGDCKDKATLLSTMLHEVGIESDYVLISTHRGTVGPGLPSPQFNHAILAIEMPPDAKTDIYRSVVTGKSGKHYLLFDPTDPYTPLGDLRGVLQDTYALLVADGIGQLIHTPLFQPEANVLSRTGRFTLSADGELSGNVVETLSGDHAVRERGYLKRANQQERTQQLERILNRSLKGFTLQSSDIRQLDELQQNLLISLNFTNPGYGQVRGPLMLVRPRVLGEKSLPVEHKPRHFAYQFEDTSRESDVYEFELPKEYVVDDMPEPVNVDMGFATYKSKIEFSGTTLRYSREFVRRDVLIKPDSAEEFRKLQGIIAADENASVVLKRAP